MEDRYNELMAKYERSRKAQDEKQTHLEAYRQELKQHDSQLPFIPELHRMAVEMSTPDGWGDDFRYSDYLSEMDYAAADSLGIDAKPGTIENPINIHLKYKPDWTQDQRAQADEKLRALSETYTVKQSAPHKRKSLKQQYLKANEIEAIPDGFDLDHIIDLQLGGMDDILNIKLLDRSVNRSLGAQIHHAIAMYEIGTVFGQFTID